MTPTDTLFRDDAYLKSCDACVQEATDDAVILDRTVFYAMGGGQPGDTGIMYWDNSKATVVDTRYGEHGAILHRLGDGDSPPPAGAKVTVEIDWPRRYLHMRMHTALHLLGAVLQYGVTGGNITAARSRLDFDMQDAIDKDDVNARLQALVEADSAVTSRFISDRELAAQPELVRTMSVKPPAGAGNVRLLDIDGIDLQPCGGTHLRSTSEVGQVRVSKVEKKGKRNRRVYIVLDD